MSKLFAGIPIVFKDSSRILIILKELPKVLIHSKDLAVILIGFEYLPNILPISKDFPVILISKRISPRSSSSLCTV